MSTCVSGIHQFVPGVPAPDLFVGVLHLRRLLRQLGYVSHIYVRAPGASLPEPCQPVSDWNNEGESLMLVHQGEGLGQDELPEVPLAQRILLWHSQMANAVAPVWSGVCRAAIALFDAGAQGLREAGATEVAMLPLLLDLDSLGTPAWDEALARERQARLNLLCVAPFVPTGGQLEAIEVFDEFLHYTDQSACLVLAGAMVDPVHAERVRARARQALGPVRLIEAPEPAALSALYRTATAFLALGQPDRFGLPAFAAMLHDVPVLAQGGGTWATVLGEGGLMLAADSLDARAAGALLQTLTLEPGLRRRVRRGQRRVLARHDLHQVREALAAFLTGLGIRPALAPPQPVAADVSNYWQVEGAIDTFYSLAIVNRNMAAALADAGVDVGLAHYSERNGGPAQQRWLDQHAPLAAGLGARAWVQQRRHALPRVSLRYQYPPWVDGLRGEVCAMHSYGWEETGFPPAYVAAANRGLDLLSTASPLVARVLRQSGVRIPVLATGTGVDHILQTTPQPFELPAAANAGFRFLHVSSCFARKGVDVLLAAWGQAFRESDDVVLIIKTFPNPHNDVAQQLAAHRARDPGYPRVVIIDAEIPEAQLLWLYQACDALVAPSRGEGFGMPIAEAMLLGLPVIVTAWGGHRAFCDVHTAWLCDYDFAFARSHLGAPHSVWAEPRASHLAALMRELRAADPAQVAARTRAARERILRDHTWARAAGRLRAAVAAVEAMPALRCEPRVGWLSTWNTRCGIATYSAFLAQAFARDRLLMLAAHSDRIETADEPFVVRCWREDHQAEALPEVEAQLEQAGVDAVVIQYNFGFYSVRALGRLLRVLHQRGVRSYLFLHATYHITRDEAGQARQSLSDITDALALADQIVVHGVDDLNRLKALGLTENTMLFPHGVPQAVSVDAEQERVRRGLGGKRVLAMYGFLLPHKGGQALIRAFARLAPIEPRLHLLFVTAVYPAPASVQEKADCEALVASLGLRDRVTLVTDFLPDAESQAWLQTAELIVYPYQMTNESASGALRGGLATGRPVAVTPLRIFDDAADAVHRLPGTDELALADGLWSLLMDPAALADLAQRAQRWCDTRRWPDVSQRLLHVIEGDLNDPPLPAGYEGDGGAGADPAGA